MIPFVFHDGGRAAAGYRGVTHDCVCRSISIATALPYAKVYALINTFGRQERQQRGRSTAGSGVRNATTRRIIQSLGGVWTPTMGIGTGCRVHLRAGELPSGRLVVSVSRHVAAVLDGVLYDTHDCSRAGSRCVYGYWRFS